MVCRPLIIPIVALLLPAHPSPPGPPQLYFRKQRAPAVNMASLGRAMRRFTSRSRLDSITDSVSLISADAPQVNLPHVDTQLNMHQFNGFFEDGSTAADGLRGRSPMFVT